MIYDIKWFPGDTFFLRTRHTDNHANKTEFNFVRDYLKSAYSTKNYTSAKAALTRILTICLDTSESDYCTFATTIASGLSGMGANTSFEKGPKDNPNTLVTTDTDVAQVRERLCQLMHIIFAKIKIYKFLVDGEGSNAYRLFHCRTSTSTNKMPILYAIFSFLLQICLTAYVIFQIYENWKADVYGDLSKSRNLPLAVLTAVYSFILARPGIEEIGDAFSIYERFGMLQMMDFIVNAILPSVLLVSGFFVIYGQDSFIESVLNTAALLFIPEIDDQLPSLLGFKEASIVKNFLISEAMKEFDAIHDDGANPEKEKMLKYTDAGMGVQFADHFITNWAEQGSSPAEGILFQPFQVSKGKKKGQGNQIDPSGFITERCLVKRIEWQYTTYEPDPKTSKPRVGYLKLVMLGGEEVEIERPEEKNILLGEKYHLEGVYVITSFQMSNDVLRLRVCGSKTAKDFETACDYYTLWPLSKNAKKLLQTAKREETKDARSKISNAYQLA